MNGYQIRGAEATFSCTGVHRFPQCFFEITLAQLSRCFYYALRLIGKKNFTSQFKDGGKGKTEPVNLGLKEKYKLHSSIQRGSEGKTKPASTGWN
jgi:hypothetical protein